MNVKHGLLHLGLTLGTCLGLPLLGWGVTDLKGFFADQGRAGFAFFTLIGAGLAAYQGLVIPETRGRPAKRISRQTVFLIIFDALGMALLFALPFLDRRGLAVIGENAGLRIWGVVLLAVGGTLLFWSEMNLGRQDSPEATLQTEHQLVTTGWYQFIRHPRYLGLILMVFGFALLFRSWIGLAATVITAGALVWRISDEERRRHQEFGAQWETYRQHTWRLIPGLW